MSACYFQTTPAGLYGEQIGQVSEQSNKNTQFNRAYKGMWKTTGTTIAFS